MPQAVSLITPTHRRDIERFSLLCESIDQLVYGYQRHYVIVNDDDVPVFERFDSGRRTVLPGSRFLPTWLRLMPAFLMRNRRRVWFSLRSGPVHGWHVQQILKISAASQLPEARFCLVDSDNVFFRAFDVGAYAGGDYTPLYLAPAAIAADSPLHANWAVNCGRLLGHDPIAFPADDHIGNVIVWDKATLLAMIGTIEQVTGRNWVEALCRTRSFSEYLLYGYFVRTSRQHLAAHRTVTQSLASAHWKDVPLDWPAVRAMVAQAPKGTVALCIESFSNTPVPFIRDAVGLSRCATDATGSRPGPHEPVAILR